MNTKNKQKITADKRSYIKNFPGDAEPTNRAQKIVCWLLEDQRRRQQLAEDVANGKIDIRGK